MTDHLKSPIKQAGEVQTTSPETPPNLCLLCGHNGVSPDGTCLAPVPICGDEYHGTRRCGCKCEFAAPVTGTGDDESDRFEQRAAQIVGTVFDNTAASHETLKQTMIERIAAALRTPEGEEK